VVWFAPDGKTLVVIGPGDVPALWDLPLGKPWGRILFWWAVLGAGLVAAVALLRRRQKTASPPDASAQQTAPTEQPGAEVSDAAAV
jgi:hypothetical protein